MWVTTLQLYKLLLFNHIILNSAILQKNVQLKIKGIYECQEFTIQEHKGKHKANSGMTLDELICKTNC